MTTFKTLVNHVAVGTVAVLALTAPLSWAGDHGPSTTMPSMSSSSMPSGMPAMPEMPKPTPQHAWLQQFVGEWEDTNQAMFPGMPTQTTTGTETVRSVGEFSIMNEVKGTMMDKPFTGVMTLGYDTTKQKYVGTWIDSMTGKLWNYEGSMDPSGKVLTLTTEGECPMKPGKVSQFKDVIEWVSQDQKRYTSYVMGDDGQWMKMMTSEARRK